MTIKKIVLFSALTVAFVAGGVSAQTAGSVTAVANPITTAVAPGTAVSLGSITLTGVNGGANVSSIPLTITGSNGGVVSNLSNCQIYDANGNSVTTGNNVINTVNTNGSNTFNLNSVIGLNSTGATTILSVRCNVASSSPAGSVFTIAAANAVPQGPTLTVNIDTAPSVPAGSTDVALANISLGATNGSFNVTSIPLTITASSNGSVTNLTDCKVRDASNLDGSLSNAVTVVNGAQSSFAFTIPFLVVPGNPQMLSLTCDVQPAAVVGSTFTLSVVPGNVSATNAATGGAVTPAPLPVGTNGPHGLPASTSGTVIVSALGTAPVDPGTGSDGDTPGVPNTGLGLQTALLSIIAIAGMVALLGALYLGRRRDA